MGPKNRKIPAKFRTGCRCKKSRKIHWRASVCGVEGEQKQLHDTFRKRSRTCYEYVAVLGRYFNKAMLGMTNYMKLGRARYCFVSVVAGSPARHAHRDKLHYMHFDFLIKLPDKHTYTCTCTFELFYNEFPGVLVTLQVEYLILGTLGQLHLHFLNCSELTSNKKNIYTRTHNQNLNLHFNFSEVNPKSDTRINYEKCI